MLRRMNTAAVCGGGGLTLQIESKARRLGGPRCWPAAVVSVCPTGQNPQFLDVWFGLLPR